MLFTPTVLPAKQYSFKVYSQQDGLLNQVINCLLQDRKGFLWVGTQNGLYRYDGSRFSFFGQEDGLPDTTIQSLFESSDGTLWVGTRLGVAKFDGRRFTRDRVLGKTELFGYSNIVSDPSGRIYVGTARGLAVLDRANKSGDAKFRFVTRESVHGVYVDPSGMVWFGAEGKLWHGENENFVASTGDARLPNDQWDSMLLDGDGNFWVRSSERLMLRRKDSRTFQSVPGAPHSPEFGFLAQTVDGHVFVPTDGGLLSYFHGQWERLATRQGLVADEATCLMQDREGSVWVGFGGEGLERWLGFEEWESWRKADGLTNDIIWDLQRDASGQLWAGTQTGLHLQDPKTGDWILKAGLDVSVHTVLDDSAHSATWYGANPGGLFRWNRKTGAVRHLGTASGLRNDHVDKLFWGPEHDLWVATRAGLFRGKLHGDDVRFEQLDLPYTDANEGFYGSFLDHLGRLWVGASRGMVMLDHGQWRRFSKSDGLIGEGVSQITETPDGAIWLGYLSNSGVSRLRFENDKVRFDHFTTKNGLTSNGVVFVGTDTRGWVWAGSDNGVDVYDGSAWKHYGKADGLVWDDCDSLAFLADRDGSVWIGTSGGVSHFHPPVASSARDALQVYITALKAGSRSLDAGNPGPIPYADRSLLISFAAPTFLRESAVRFRYRMLGLESDWVDAEDRWVRYANLNAGTYSFQVAALDAEGHRSKKAATVNLVIAPPWWQTWQFRSVGALLLLTLTRRLWSLRIRYLVKKQERLEALLSQAQTADRLKSEALARITKGEAREKGRNHVLELMSSHQPLGTVLDALIEMVESDDPDTICLILTLRARHFEHASARRFPSELARQFEGSSFSSPETCFAAAACRAGTVSVIDVASSSLWASYHTELSDLGITCSRSTPILSSSAEVLGTITFFRKTPFADSDAIPDSMRNAERLASVAIEHLSLYEQLSYRAQYDELTALPNRVLFQNRLRQAIARAERSGAKLWVLGLDLDGFKHVNDTLGHQAGDALLQKLAHRISGCLRKDDTAARMGGDEFSVLIEGGNGTDLEAVIQKLIFAIREPVPIAEQEVLVTASVGVSVYPDHARDGSELVKKADLAMYHAKRLGKNTHSFFAPEMASSESSRIEVEGCLRNALAGGEFELYYQPQYTFDRSLSGFEALLRWTNGKLGSVSPARFIPVAETTGLIVPIGQWILEEACRQTADWIAAGFTEFRMAVNVSARQFARADFPESVSHLLRAMGVSPQRLELELTETAIMSDAVESSAQLSELRDHGIAVAIDDFGTGYSSLSYLQRLPVDAIKIDRSFIQGLDSTYSSSLTMIQGIVNLAHGLGLRVVAEGVETEGQWRQLQRGGCDLAQGFLLSKPLSARDATLLLERETHRSRANVEESLVSV